MDHPIFQILLRKDFIKGNEVAIDKVRNTSVSTLIDIAKTIFDITSAADFGRENSIFAHSASFSIGGGRRPCADLDSRMTHIDQLARFSALYSDRVYIYNFMSDYLTGDIDPTKESEFRTNFTNDLIMLNSVRPLIERNILVPYSFPKIDCINGLVSTTMSDDWGIFVNQEHKRLNDLFLNNVDVIFKREAKERYLFIEKGPEDFVTHGTSYRHVYLLWPEIKNMHQLMRKVDSGQEVTLSKTILKKSKYHDFNVNYILKNISFGLSTSRVFRTSFLTDSDIHVDILNSISRDPFINKRNQIVKEHLSTMVPFVNDIGIGDLLKIRDREQESFILFRYRLNSAINEVKKAKKKFSDREAMEIYSEFILPEIAKVDRKIKAAKRDLIITTRRKAISCIGTITFGIYAGMVSFGLQSIAAAIGLKKISDNLCDIMDKSDFDDSIRNEDMYILWKVKQSSVKK
jgi:hypothetical protein